MLKPLPTGKFFMVLVLGLSPLAGVQEAGDSDPVVAEISGYRLTQSGLDKLLELLPEDSRAQMLDPAKKEEFIRNWMENVLLHREATVRGLDQQPEVQRRLEVERLQLLAAALKKDVQDSVTLEDSDLEKFYEKNKELLKHPPMSRLSQIVLGSRAEALEVIDLLNSGEDFATLAEARSKDARNRGKGGVLGWIFPNQLEPALDQAAFGLELNQLSGPLRTSQGWHVVKVLERRQAGYLQLEEVRERLRSQLIEVKKKEMFAAFVKELATKYELKIHPVKP